MNRDLRNRSYGQIGSHTAVDRLGVWLSAQRIQRIVGRPDGLRIADIGSGYHGTIAAQLIRAGAGEVTLVDVAIADTFKQEQSRARALEGYLPDVLVPIPDGSIDVAICNSVVEHLWSPQDTLDHCHRILRDGGRFLVNVPSWRGKRFLEMSAYKFGLSPAEEMDDHKMYYDPRDLWPLLVRAGFAPRHIRCFKHKFGLNTFAICTKVAAEENS
jgi:SAM-dependent methyltransferase